MNKLEINLLPPELNISKQESLKKKLILRSSIAFLSLTIISTIIIFVIVITRSLDLQNVNNNYENAKQKVSSLKDQEAVVTVLKGRVTTIGSLIQKESSEVEAYNLITDLMPQNVNLLSLSVDKNKKLQLSGETANTALLDTFFNNLTDPKSHEGKISGTTINNLSVGSGTRIRFDLTISLAQK